MIELIIFWIGMYLLFEIVAIDYLGYTMFRNFIELKIDHSMRVWLRIAGVYILLLCLAPFFAVWVVCEWIGQHEKGY